MIKNFKDFINEESKWEEGKGYAQKGPFFLPLIHGYYYSSNNKEADKHKNSMKIGTFVRDIIKIEEFAKKNDKVVLTKMLDIELTDGGKDFIKGGNKGDMFEEGVVYIYPFANPNEAGKFVKSLKSSYDTYVLGGAVESTNHEENVEANGSMTLVKEEYREEAEEFLLDCFKNKTDLID